MSTKPERKCLPTFADLLDELTIVQIKQVMLPEGRASFTERLDSLSHDLDLLIKKHDIKLSSKLIRIIVVLAQMNLHIWHNKEKLHANEPEYDRHLKLSHQLNGIRNQMKNLMLEEAGESSHSTRKSNFNADGLVGWEVGIK
jgi:hypothetical protein